ncbi:unnamed protein product, partial [Meganyctiphanes norvegica]
KKTLTVLALVNATGKGPPPLLVYPRKTLPPSIRANITKNYIVNQGENSYFCGHNSTGYINFELLYEYLVNGFQRWLKSSGIKLPVIVFADWHETRCNYYLATAMNKAGIHLIGLIPNATQMVQPLDLSFFKPFKVEYKRRAEAWRRENGMASINLTTFASIALPSYHACLKAETIGNGFRKAGIHPWNPEAVDYSRAAAIEAQAQVPDPLQGVDIAGKVHRGTDAYKTLTLCVETQTEWWGHCRHDPGIMQTSLDDDVIHRKRLENMLCILNGRAMAFSRGLGYSIVTARTPEQIEKAKKDELARAKKSQGM